MKTINNLVAAIVIISIFGCGSTPNQSGNSLSGDTAKRIVKANDKIIPPDTLKKRLIRAGELLVSGENMAELKNYFNTTDYRFHGPDGHESNCSQLFDYFKAYRAAFDNLSIKRGLIVKEGDFIACQTWITGKFTREFTMSPVGKLPPNGKRVVQEIINIFRFDDHGRLVEEWVQGDNRSYLRQLGAEGK